MDPWEPRQLEIAKALFGTPLRVQLAEWVLSRDKVQDAFIQTEAIDGVRPVTRSTSSVPGALETFVDAGMLDRNDLQGRVYYRPSATPLWGAFSEALRGLGRTIPEHQFEPSE